MGAKVKLSANELALVTDCNIIFTKNSIIQKVYTLFGALASQFDPMVSSLNWSLPAIKGSKIAKGEHYEGLPWVMLDTIRIFNASASLSVRTFFWWGHDCSMHLYIGGQYVQAFAPAIRQYFVQHPCTDWFFCVHQNPWQHHFKHTNYLPLLPEHLQSLETKSFIKLAKKIPLQAWDITDNFMLTCFEEICCMLQTKPLNGETNL